MHQAAEEMKQPDVASVSSGTLENIGGLEVGNYKTKAPSTHSPKIFNALPLEYPSSVVLDNFYKPNDWTYVTELIEVNQSMGAFSRGAVASDLVF